jgi:hypothetical protein
MSETVPTPQQPSPGADPNNHVQHLINIWDIRPRRQIDFSMLTEESRQDCEWIAKVIQALIPAVWVIAEKFDMRPSGVIMLPGPSLTGLAASQAHFDSEKGSGQRVNAPEPITEAEPAQPASHKVQPAEQGEPLQSNDQETMPAAASSNGNPKRRGKRARSASRKRRTADKVGKFSAALAKAGVTLSDPEPPPTQPEVPSKQPGPDLSDPPAPALSEIG